MMHRDERRRSTSKRVRETEAEAVAFVVCSAIGLETGTAAQDYIGLYGGARNSSTRALNASSGPQLKFSVLSTRMNHPRRPTESGTWYVLCRF